MYAWSLCLLALLFALRPAEKSLAGTWCCLLFEAGAVDETACHLVCIVDQSGSAAHGLVTFFASAAVVVRRFPGSGAADLPSCPGNLFEMVEASTPAGFRQPQS
jgi:hypothetical protein